MTITVPVGCPDRNWTDDQILDAALDWRERYGRLPRREDWKPAKRWPQERRARYAAGRWPSHSTVATRFGSFADMHFLAGARSTLVSEEELAA